MKERRKASHVSKNLEAARKDLYETPRAKTSELYLVTSYDVIHCIYF